MKKLISIILLLLITPALWCQYHDFRSNNWEDGIQDIVLAEGTDYTAISTVQVLAPDGTTQTLSLKQIGLIAYQYRRSIFNEITDLYYILRPNNLVATVYSLKLTPDRLAEITKSINDKYGAPRVQRHFKFPISVGTSPLLLIDDYWANDSVIRKLERTPNDTLQDVSNPVDVDLLRFNGSVTTVYIISALIKDTIVVLCLETKENF